MADTRTIDADAIVAEAVEASKYHDLVFIDRGDQLSDGQLVDLFDGEVDRAMESVDDWLSEAVEEGLRSAISALPDELRERIEDAGLEERVREALVAADESAGEAFGDLVGRRGSELLLYKLGAEDANADEPDVERAYGSNDEVYLAEREAAQREAITKILTGIGLDVTTEKNAAAVDMLIAENLYHGGVMYVAWYGPIAEWVRLLIDENYSNPGWDTERTVTFTDPFIAVHEHWSGAGFSEFFEGTVTMPWSSERLRLDRATHYSLDETYGFHLPALAADPTITPTPTEDS